ncbi:MAG: exonuclease domain-containing protein [Anaerolineae bacterium]
MTDLNALIDDTPLVFVDVETTGLDPRRGDRVCEIAMVLYRGREVVDALQRLIYPQRAMDPGAQRVHGISDAMLRDAPPFGQVATDILDLLSGGVIVGHNVLFDVGFLAAEFQRIGSSLPSLCMLDTVRLARRLYRLPSYSLGNLTGALGIAVEGKAHRAMVDVLLTRAVFERIGEDLARLGMGTLGDYLEAQGGSLQRGSTAEIEVPSLVRAALQEGGLLRLCYVTEQGTESTRLVRPLAVESYGGAAMLIAHCYLRDATRHFRMDRIVAMELVKE